MNPIMNLFSNPVKSVTDKSSKILDVFTSTVNDLKNVNAEVDSHISTNEEQKRKLEENLAALNQVKNDNNKVIEKINKLFV